MYIFISSTYLPLTGGKERFLSSLLFRIAKKGFPLALFTPRLKRNLPLAEKNVNFLLRRLRYLPIRGIGSCLFIFNLLAVLFSLRKQFGVICLCSPKYEIPTVAFFCRLLGKKTFVRFSGSRPLKGMLAAAKTRFVPFISSSIKKIDYFIVLTDKMKDYLVAEQVPEEKIKIIPNGVDTDFFKPLEDEKKEEKKFLIGLAKKRVLLYCGRLVREKGVTDLLAAFTRLSPGFGAKLLLCGRGELEKELADYAAANGLDEDVRFMGEDSNVVELMQIADIFISPSYAEGVSNAVLEAMSCALPCIVTQASSGVVTDRQSGIVIPAGDINALSKAVNELLGNTALAGSLGKAARETAREKYNIDKIADAYIEQFEAVLKWRKQG